ncbi:MAG: cyclic nucleotide-binding domain-containing protein [Phycisphaera sp.]|nr:cyclic nucleotide-binding domain-containing protein [Phycisphaera sp.]
MDTNGILDTLSRCPLFAGLDPEGRLRLTSQARQKRYAAGEVIARQDFPAPGVFIVQVGQVRVVRLAPGNKEHVLHLCGPGQTVAEVAVLGEFAMPATIQAIEETTCVLLPAGPLMRALREDHALCLQLLGGMSRWVHHLVDLMEDIVLRDAVERVARYLLAETGQDKPTLNFAGTKQHIASHLNLTGETLSRVLRRLDDAGLITRINQHEVRVRHREMLGGVANGHFPRI